MSSHAWSIAKKSSASLSLLVVLAIGVGIFTYMQNVKIRTSTDWNYHTYDVMAQLEDVAQGVLNQEAALRGYLLTADTAFLPRFEKNRKQAEDGLAGAKALTADNPAQQQTADELAQAMAAWHSTITDKQIELVRSTTGVEEARRMERAREGKPLLTKINELTELMASREESLLSVRKATADDAMSASTLAALVGSALSALGAIAIALFVGRSIASPIRAMTAAMNKLAEGDNTVIIPSAGRGDEIGAMSKAVQVFKDNALEKVRLEEEATALKQRQEAQRDRQTAIDNSKAEDLRTFVHAVDDGFNALSSGDLTVRMNQAVAPEFEPIRAKFNDSVAKLEEAIGSVVTSVSSIRNGLSEITVASNDLAQRTEQQAASLEETVAALSAR